jgi:transposase
VGDVLVRAALQWAVEVAKRRCMKRANVALARKARRLLHRMSISGSEFRFSKEAAAL